uniref:Morc S5 domain-containing protein n=1 Tax=Strigamia maritima TaxID=126957 RepID=T1JMG3_STRMM
MPPSYTGLTRAQLSYDYLHSNSTTHEFLFGALAEILDNSRDANASKMDIFTVNDIRLRGGVRLYLLDDGEGMDPTETAKVVTFGLSHKKSMDSKQIGQYGNGLKSGSMRIANDMILFTKKSGIMTCLMLSRTFHEEDKISEVIVPLPSFNSCGLSPVYGKGKSQEHHEIEMALILKYSPFHTREEFLEQFSRIEAESGTLVILYNLKLLDTGVTELDFKTNPEDILIAETDLLRDKILVTEKYSFRAYVALLYSEPRMKVYVQGKKVHAHRLVYDLYKPRTYEYTSSRFKTRAKEVANKAEVEYKLAKQKLKDTEGRAREFEKINLPKLMSSEDRAKLRTLQAAASELRTDVERKKLDYDVQQRSLKEPKTLSFIFGINLENRKNDGLFIYNCNRLIKMYVRVGPQLEGEQKCRGVVGT